MPIDNATQEPIMSPDQAEQPSLPRIIQSTMHRKLEPIDREIIFKGAAGWWLFFAFLHSTKLPCDEAAMVLHGNVDRERKILVRSVHKSGRILGIPLSGDLLKYIPEDLPASEPLFPKLYCDIEDPVYLEEQLNENLAVPSEFMQALLAAENRPLATLFSFRVTASRSLPDVVPQVGN